MLVIVGFLVVIGSVAGGYLWHGGKMMLLSQPPEFLIIGGAAVGILLTSTPMAVLRDMVGQLARLMKSPPTRQEYAEVLSMLYQLFRVVQASGVMALESHFDNPQESAILSKYPKFLARKGSLSFLADSARVIIVGGISSHDFEHLMHTDMEVREREQLMPAGTLMKVGDALPGLGIVAAVLGVVITMQAIDGPPSEIGEKVGAALVGTFLGILLSYGFVNPLATTMENRCAEELVIDQATMAGLLAIYKGFSPAIAIEFARRVVPEEVRPSFEETEELCRVARTDSSSAAAA